MNFIKYSPVLLLFVFANCHSPKLKSDNSFSVIAFGDMPYQLPQDYFKFEHLIQNLNNGDQDFNVFVGDFKSSSTHCSDEAFYKIKSYFNNFNKALIYTPGDNEWTDCWKPEAGAYDPEERLTKLRSLFFTESKSFGKKAIPLSDESDFPEYKLYKENKLWIHKNICFSTLHVVGSNNHCIKENDSINTEFTIRNEANLFWLNHLFQTAKDSNCKALVIFSHADMFNPNFETTGFVDVIQTVKSLTLKNDFQVIWVNGDEHKFLVDKPLKHENNQTIMNFTRVQVFGETDMQVVKFNFNPDSKDLFSVHSHQSY
jgi:hypothetical protein